MEDSNRKVFCFAGYAFNDNPSDLLLETIEGLSALELMVASDDDHQLNDRRAAGIRHLINGFIGTLESVKELVSERITDPYAAGYRAGTKALQGEYSRGFREGQARAILRRETVIGDVRAGRASEQASGADGETGGDAARP